MPSIHVTGAAGPVYDLAMIAGMTLVFVAILRKIMLALPARVEAGQPPRKMFGPDSTAFAGISQGMTIAVAFGLIELATYFPATFATLSAAVGVAAGASGTYGYVKNRAVQPAVPVVDLPGAAPVPTPALAPAPTTPAVPSESATA